jgi:prefoldin subunit 5
MGSSDGNNEALEKLTAEIKELKTAQQKIKSSLDKLAPLAPVADQLAAVPSKVVTL